MEGCLQFGTFLPLWGAGFRKRGLISCSMIYNDYGPAGKDAIAVDAPAGNNTGNDFSQVRKFGKGLI